MILDALNMLSDHQAVVADATTVSTNSFRLPKAEVDGSGEINLGDGEPMAVIFTIHDREDADDAFVFNLIVADNAALTTNATVIATSGIKTDAQLTALGDRIILDVPLGALARPWFGAQYVTTTGDTLEVSAHLVPKSFIEKQRYYPRNFEV